jgi:hypothetical protein
MPNCVHCLQTLDELRAYVNETLCLYDNLEVGAFSFTERILVRAGRPCGILFRLHGPRAVQFLAIWETDENTILFYNSSGERFQKTQLMAAPRLELQSA